MGPTYDLHRIQELVQAGRYVPTTAALRGLSDLALDREDMEQCVLSLTHSDFHKSDQSRQQPALFLDVYRPTYCGQKLYVKLQLCDDGRGPAVIVSFKRK